MNETRVWRQHVLMALFVPGLPWCLLIVVVAAIVVVLAPHLEVAPWMLILAAYPALRAACLAVDWSRHTITITAETGVLLERAGLVRVRERRVPLLRIVGVQYDQPGWLALLHIDAGHLTISAMGGPYIFRWMGDFAALRQAVQSEGQIVPMRQRRNARAGVARWAQRSRRLAAAARPHVQAGALRVGRAAAAAWRAAPRTWDAVRVSRPAASRQQAALYSAVGAAVPLSARIPDGGHVYKGMPFSPRVPSRPGFLAFCEQFVLGEKNWTKWRYRTRDPNRQYYPRGIGENVARIYLDILRQTCVVIPGAHDQERLSGRVRAIADIERLVAVRAAPLGDVA